MRKTNINDIEYHYAELDLALISEEKYASLSHRDIVLFTLLKNQESLSLKNVMLGKRDYVDSNGDVFIKIAQEKLAKILRISQPTLRAGLKALEKLNLIEVITVGKNKCNIMYIGSPESTITYSKYIENIGEEIEFNKIEKAKDKEETKVTKVKPKNINDCNKKDLSVGADKPSSNKITDQFVNSSIPKNNNNMQVENNENFKIIKENGITITKNTSNKVKESICNWDKTKLLQCIEYMLNNKSSIIGFNINYLNKIYNNPIFMNKNNNIDNTPKVKTRFHNINESFSKYTPDELEKLLQESQKNKFKKV